MPSRRRPLPSCQRPENGKTARSLYRFRPSGLTETACVVTPFLAVTDGRRLEVVIPVHGTPARAGLNAVRAETRICRTVARRCSVKYTVPSAPTATEFGPLASAILATAPAGVMRRMLLPP